MRAEVRAAAVFLVGHVPPAEAAAILAEVALFQVKPTAMRVLADASGWPAGPDDPYAGEIRPVRRGVVALRDWATAACMDVGWREHPSEVGLFHLRAGD